MTETKRRIREKIKKKAKQKKKKKKKCCLGGECRTTLSQGLTKGEKRPETTKEPMLGWNTSIFFKNLGGWKNGLSQLGEKK